MDQYLIVIGCFFLLGIVLIIWMNGRSNNTEYIPMQLYESNFLISLKILDMTIDNYCDSYFIDHINTLKKQYDLDNNSQTQSIDQFNKKYIEEVQSSIKIILDRYLSDVIKDQLLIYFSMDGLILYIMSRLSQKN